MKTIFRILVILVIAVLVGGLFYSVITASSGTNQTSISEGSFRADGEFNRSDRGDESSGLQLPADSIKNLAIISLVAIFYVNITKWLRRGKSVARLAP